MNLIDEQIVGLMPLASMPKNKALMVVIGNECQNALKSLKEQLYTNFDLYCVEDNPLRCMEGKLDIGKLPDSDITREIGKALVESDAEYVYLLDGKDLLTANALLEYARCMEERDCPDLIYANEAIRDSSGKSWMNYRIKPLSSKIALFQSLYIGKAIMWKRELLSSILKDVRHGRPDSLHRELFLLAMASDCRIEQLSDILLIKAEGEQAISQGDRALHLLQRGIDSHTNWEGRIGRTSSYGIDCYELISDKQDRLSQTGFIIVESDLNRTLQLLSQLNVSCRQNEVVVGVRKEHRKKITAHCSCLNFSNVTIIIRDKSYADTLIKLIGKLQSPYQVILNDLVRWVNRMNLERLMKCFLKPEVMAAVPQIATEGDAPVLVYAGAGINNLSLNSPYFKGRLQKPEGNQDTAWANCEASMLSPYCLAVRRDLWKEILPLHPTVQTERHFANEISFLCLKKGIICEYSAQSAVWVSEEVKGYYRIDEETDEANLADCTDEPRLSGNYWHLLSAYGDLIEEKRKGIPHLYRSHERHLKEDFQAFGLEHVSDSEGKRVLVMTHELSLTGAPLVLVQAVRVLVQSGFHVLVVSPEDGPLRETYLQMKVPVMVDPQLQSDFEYIKVAYDFHFTIVSTVVLWQCIEAFGKTDLPVLWWVHDSRIGYENYLRYVIPETIGENILLYCGGDYAKKVITEYRPKYQSSILLYGVEDFSHEILQTVDRSYWGLPEDKMVFANIGQIIERKGQDILVRAIRLLPEDTLRKCAFVFVGSVIDRGIHKQIMALKEAYPKNIFYIKQMPYDLLKEFYREIDGVICSSIDDPLPAFVSEAMLMSRICICSSNSAFRSIITSGENGYLFESGDADGLCAVIRHVADEEERQQAVKQNARKLYESTFAPEIFARNFTRIISDELLT